MDADDPADTELYQFGCHRIGQCYVGYMSVFYLRDPQQIDIHLATSRDGIHFTRVCRDEPFISFGALGYYDCMAMACSQPEPIIVDDTVYVYCAAANFPHSAMWHAPIPASSKSVLALPRSSEIALLPSKRAIAIQDRAALQQSRSRCGTSSYF